MCKRAIAVERRPQAIAERRRSPSPRGAAGGWPMADRRRREANSGIAAGRSGSIAKHRTANLQTANTNLTKGGLALRKSTLLAEARLAARRSEQLMSSGDQTYQLGVLLAAEAVRHACASSGDRPDVDLGHTTVSRTPVASQPGIQIDGSVAEQRARRALERRGAVRDRPARRIDLAESPGRGRPTGSASRRTRRRSRAGPRSCRCGTPTARSRPPRRAPPGLTPESALSGDGNVLA